MYLDGCEGIEKEERFDGSHEKYSSFLKLIGMKMENIHVKTCLRVAIEWESTRADIENPVAEDILDMWDTNAVTEDQVERHCNTEKGSFETVVGDLILTLQPFSLLLHCTVVPTNLSTLSWILFCIYNDIWGEVSNFFNFFSYPHKFLKTDWWVVQNSFLFLYSWGRVIIILKKIPYCQLAYVFLFCGIGMSVWVGGDKPCNCSFRFEINLSLTKLLLLVAFRGKYYW